MKAFFNKGIWHFLFLCLLFVSCESEYSQIVKQEMKTGVVYEDLIFDLKIGQTRKEFYERCWQLNKEQVVSQGPGNQFAQHIMTLDSTSANPQKVRMLFYGIFDDEKIMHGMHMKMSYLNWSPWNETFQSKALMKKLREKYEAEYPGNTFIPIEIEVDKKAFVKVDGNRQILMYPLSNKDVTVKIEDLRFKKSERLKATED